MASAFPFNLPVKLIFQLELVARYKPHVILVWKDEKGHPLFIDVPIPPYFDVVLCLGFFEQFIVVGLKFYQWFKNILVLFGVFVPEEHWLLIFFFFYIIEILKFRVWVMFP